MDLLLNVLGLLLIVSIALFGIAGSGLLAARRMAHANPPDRSTDAIERKTES